LSERHNQPIAIVGIGLRVPAPTRRRLFSGCCAVVYAASDCLHRIAGAWIPNGPAAISITSIVPTGAPSEFRRASCARWIRSSACCSKSSA